MGNEVAHGLRRLTGSACTCNSACILPVDCQGDQPCLKSRQSGRQEERERVVTIVEGKRPAEWEGSTEEAGKVEILTLGGLPSHAFASRPCLPRSPCQNVDTLPSSWKKPFEIALVRGRTLGLIVAADKHGLVVVEDIWDPSPIATWNASHDESMQVRVGDVITAVNGEPCMGEALMEKIRAVRHGETVRLLIEASPNIA